MRIDCDDTVHYPLGGASYIFKSSFIKYIASQITKKNKSVLVCTHDLDLLALVLSLIHLRI